MAREILRRAAAIDATPFVGRKVPEFDDDSVREIPTYSWRIIYQVRDGKIFIVTLIHKRRHVEPEQVSPPP